MTILMERDSDAREQRGDRCCPNRLSTDEVLAVLVHELRSPLGAIQNALHILRLARTADPVVDQEVDVMQRQVGHLARLIGDLRDLTRVTLGKLELHQEWLDLASVVAHAVEACRPLIEQSGHQLTVSLPAGLVRLRADPARLQQILVNLLTNAAKYTAPGGHIWLTADAAAGVPVVRVRDNGMGIAPDLLPHIFDLFRQGPGPGNRRRGGLGIGLALVKWLVELHGGSVAACSDGPGQGSEFVVRWPAPTGLAARKALLALAPPKWF
jgi:signal transduction histidine kinase